MMCDEEMEMLHFDGYWVSPGDRGYVEGPLTVAEAGYQVVAKSARISPHSPLLEKAPKEPAKPPRAPKKTGVRKRLLAPCQFMQMTLLRRRLRAMARTMALDRAPEGAELPWTKKPARKPPTDS